MTESTTTTSSEASLNLSEAERMARIRDLLVGPVIADETAKHEETVGRLDQTLADQSALIMALNARVDELEQAQRVETERLDLRLLGMVEALLADEQGLRHRLSKSEPLQSYLADIASRAKRSGEPG